MKNDQVKQGRSFGSAGWLAALILSVYLLGGCAGSQTAKTPSAETPKKSVPQPRVVLSADWPVCDRTRLQEQPLVFSGLSPHDPQPADTALAPGVAVAYFYNYFHRHLNPLTNGKLPNNEGTPGEPILYLNHEFGRKEVFGSGQNRGVAMRMKGMLHFDKSGSYTLFALSNDGLRIYLDDQLVIDDPAWHARGNQYSQRTIAEISQPGWYPLKVEFFQRKGTTALGFYWRRPGADGFEPVPAAVYGHIPVTAP